MKPSQKVAKPYSRHESIFMVSYFLKRHGKIYLIAANQTDSNGPIQVSLALWYSPFEACVGLDQRNTRHDETSGKAWSETQATQATRTLPSNIHTRTHTHI